MKFDVGHVCVNEQGVEFASIIGCNCVQVYLEFQFDLVHVRNWHAFAQTNHILQWNGTDSVLVKDLRNISIDTWKLVGCILLHLNIKRKIK